MTTDQSVSDTLSDTLAPLVAELASVAEARGALEARERQIKAAIRALVPGPDRYGAGDRTVEVTPNRRFDAAGAAERWLSLEQRAAAFVGTYDGKAVRQYLTPEQVELHMVDVGEPRVVLR